VNPPRPDLAGLTGMVGASRIAELMTVDCLTRKVTTRRELI